MRKRFLAAVLLIALVGEVVTPAFSAQGSYFGTGDESVEPEPAPTREPQPTATPEPTVEAPSPSEEEAPQPTGEGEGGTSIPPAPVYNTTNVYNQTFIYELPLAWSAVAGIRCTNNELGLQDYRMDHDTFRNICQRFNITITNEAGEQQSVAAKEDLFVSNERRSLAGLDSSGAGGEVIAVSTEKAWLIEHNIISSIEHLDLFSEMKSYLRVDTDPEETFFKCDLWMALDKIGWGVIPSRLIYEITEPERNGVPVTEIEGYVMDGTAINARFVGDWNVYAFPNVYELYFKDLVDRGLLSLSEFAEYSAEEGYHKGEENVKAAGIAFANAYRQMLLGADLLGSGSYPAWSPDLEPMQYKGGGGIVRNSLGRAWSVEGNTIERKRYADNGKGIYFFKRETITVLDALKIIKKFMEYTEPQMTDMETKVILYKYGVRYINDLDKEEDKEAVTFAIAKGILNWEDASEFDILHDRLNAEVAYRLLYRVANKDARYLFHYIQLTDAESFWQELGFQETMIEFFGSEILAEDIPWGNAKVEGSEIIIEEEQAPEGELSLFALEDGGDEAAADAGQDVAERGYSVVLNDVRALDQYSFGRWSLSWLSGLRGDFQLPRDVSYLEREVGSNWEVISSGDLPVRVEQISVYQGSYGITIHAVAESEEEALVLAKSALKVSTENSLGMVEGVINAGNLTMISKSSLVAGDGLGALSDVVAVSNNILKNTKTGVMAVILDGQDIALVGNQVIRMEKPMVVTDSEEVYYNLEVIASLLPLAYVKHLNGAKSVIFNCTSICMGQSNSVCEVTDEAGEVADEFYLYTHAGIWFDASTDSGEEYRASRYVNLAEMDKAFNTIYRTFYDGDGEFAYTVVVDWKYVFPESVTLDTKTDGGSAVDVPPDPEREKDACKFWYNNLMLSNALANYVYGTKDFQYFSSGWCTPCVTILFDADKVDTTEVGELLPVFYLTDEFTSLMEYFGTEEVLPFRDYFLKLRGNGSVSSGEVSYLAGERTIDLQQMRKTVAKDVDGSSLKGVERRISTYAPDVYVFSSITPKVKKIQSASSTRWLVGSDYLVTRSGLVYKSFDYEVAGGGTVQRLEMDGSAIRLVDDADRLHWMPPSAGETIQVAGEHRSFSCAYFGTAEVGGILCHVLQPLTGSTGFEPFYSVNAVAGQSLGEVMEAAEDYYVSVYRELTGGAANFNFDGRTEEEKAELFRILVSRETDPPYKTAKFVRAHRSNGAKMLCYGTDGLQVVDGDGKVESTSQVTAGTLLYVPMVFCIPVNGYSWRLLEDGSYRLYGGQGASIRQSVYCRGINNRIIDSLFYQYLDLVSISEIPVGGKLLIGSVTYTKTEEGTFRSRIRALRTASVTQEWLNSRLTNDFRMLIYYGGNFNLSSPLSNYVKEDGMGRVSSYRPESDEGKGYIYRDGRKLVDYSGEAFQFGDGIASGMRIEVTLSDDLMCRELNGNTYLLACVTNSYVSGFGDSPFTYESVELKEPIVGSFEGYSYENPEIEDKADIIAGIKQKFEETKQKDFKTVLLMILLVGCILLLVVCWFTYFVLSQGLFKIALESLADMFLRDDGTRGFDPLKFVSFGIFSLDSEPRVSRLIFATIVILVLMAVIGLLLTA